MVAELVAGGRVRLADGTLIGFANYSVEEKQVAAGGRMDPDLNDSRRSTLRAPGAVSASSA